MRQQQVILIKEELLYEFENAINKKVPFGGEIILNQVVPNNMSAIYLTNIKTSSDTGGIIRKGKYPIHEISVIVLQELVKRYTNILLPIYYLDYDFYNKTINKSINELESLKRKYLINKIIDNYKKSEELSYDVHNYALPLSIDHMFLKKTRKVDIEDSDKYNDFINKYTYIDNRITVRRFKPEFIEAINNAKNNTTFRKFYIYYFSFGVQQIQDDDIILAHSDYLVKEIRMLYDEYLKNKIPIPIKIINAIEISKIEEINLRFHNQLDDAKARGFTIFDLDVRS